MSTPPSPEDQPGSGTESEPSPTRKRNHSEMAAGQQGTQRASPPVEISSARSDSDGVDDNSVKPTSTPPHKNGKAEEQPETEFRVDEDELDPEQPLGDYDWQDLERRFHKAMDEKTEEDDRLSDEFARLIAKSESELEKKREHYMKVVEAFESALRLLEA
ncbi:hypothetical protein SLS58_000728 [Diplodia intermedia]|uniref:Uncharacterized protein n=1 Tax=Diplodia intermedia TaxID=856260 RepID=A0ABR3U4J3_9PEZI